MTIVIDENIIIFIAGGLFIPLFIFLMKMIMKSSELESKVNTLIENQKDTKNQRENIVDMKSDIKVLKLRMDNAEVEIRGSGAPHIDYDGTDNK